MGILSKISKSVYNPLNINAFAIAHPIKSVTSLVGGTYKEEQKKFLNQSLGKEITQIAVGGASIIATVSGVGAVATASKAGTLASSTASVAKSLIPKSTVGKVVASVSIPVVAGVAVANPKQTGKALIEAPQNLANVGLNLGKVGADPSLENLSTLYKENPIITGALTAGGVIVAGKAVSGVVSSALNTSAIRQNTKATKQLLNQSEVPTENIPSQEVIPTDTTTPQGQPVKAISSTGSTKRRKKKAKKQPQSISQRVNITFDNDRIDNKKYLKRSAY